MMSLGDLPNLGQIIGAIAVVVSLIYVALQIRQNTNAVRAATSQSVHEHFANWYNSLACDAVPRPAVLQRQLVTQPKKF